MIAAYGAYVAPDGRTADQLVAAHVLPNPGITPGFLNREIDPSNVVVTVCKSGWTATIRPPVSYTDPLRKEDAPPGVDPAKGELDHLVSLEIGGDPRNPLNLWWQVYDDVYGARVKDRVETKLKTLVCSGKISLTEAQDAIISNWLTAYEKYVGPLPSASSPNVVHDSGDSGHDSAVPY